MQPDTLPGRRRRQSFGKNTDGSQSSFTDHRLFLINEARALLTRLDNVKSFGLTMPMVAAANISKAAQRAIYQTLSEGVSEMKQRILAFIGVMQSERELSAEKAQKAFAILKLKFNWLLDSLDIFADVLTMRGEHNTGIWLSGMDALAEDSLRLEGRFYSAPPLITYLDRGHGAAIRRARTRLPGGRSNPVAVIRVPRERLVSTGIASSLVHEVGHQGASLLGLIPSLRREIFGLARRDSGNTEHWNWYERWISEILSDLWGVAMIGIGATTGLINVVSVPSYFVFRLNADDPHPPPWIRVRLSIAFGTVLFPDPQWQRLRQLWDRLYPLQLAGADLLNTYQRLEMLIPEFVRLVITHRAPALKGKELQQVFPLANRQPGRLRELYKQWAGHSRNMIRARPSLVFAAIGQARADGVMPPRQENALLVKMLRAWALRRNIM
jgi:hypothetical protein